MVFVVAVSVWVQPDKVDAFRESTLINGRATRREAGNLRFDISQCVDDPARFLLYEAYRDEAAFKAHQQTPHYLEWRGTVADWMARPREGIKHRALFPENESAWVAATGTQ
jgi:autoinducer 2-degrading protein